MCIHIFNDALTLCVVIDLHIRVGIMIDYNCLQWKTLALFVHLGGKTMKTCEVCINNIVFFIYVYNMHNLIGWEHVDMQTNGGLLAHGQLCIPSL